MRRLLPLYGALLLAACNQGPEDRGTSSATEPARRSGCGDAALPISQIQGRSLASPLLGQRVTVEAIVTALAPALGGAFVQEQQADRDGDPLTSEGLFLLTDPSALTVGQLVRVEGVVTEHSDGESTITSLSELGSQLGCNDSGLPEPFVIEQPPLMIDDWEALEGMRVSVEPVATVLAPDRLLAAGELLVSLSGRQFIATETAAPGEDARKLAADNQRSRLVLDTRHRGAGELLQQLGLPSTKQPWRVGTQVVGIAGIFSQRNGRAVIHLNQPLSVIQALRPENPPDIEGQLRVVSYNTLNLFNGDGKGGEFPTPRGASSTVEWQRQLDKHVSVLSKLKADVIALMELENDQGGDTAAEAQLVRSLNRALGKAGDYVAVVPPALPLGTDQIRVGLIYRKSKVNPDGPALSLLDAPFDGLHRPPLLQRFIDRSSKQSFTVVSNHFKSKGGCQEADPGNHDRDDGQGCFNAARVEAARELAAWVSEQAGDPAQSAILLLGDFNAYAQEDPIRLLAEQGFARVRVEDPDYSFVFDGQSGSLDHALASTRLRQMLGTAAVWHINADESQAFDYEVDGNDRFGLALTQNPTQARKSLARLYRADPYRSSDHDPLLIGLNLVPAPAAEPASKSSD